MKFKAEMGHWFSVVGNSVHLIGEDGRLLGQIAIMFQDNRLREKDVQTALCEKICAALNADPCAEAADLIIAQAEENRRLREALSPFADVAEHDIGTDEADCDVFRPMLRANRAPYLTVGDLRRARAALSSTGEK